MGEQLPVTYERTRRQEIEADVYDARIRSTFAKLGDSDLGVDPKRPPFANREHVDFLSFALALLGPPADRRILEVGCGTGSLSVYLGLLGASVCAIDVSSENVRLAQRRAAVNGLRDQVRVRAIPVEHLDDPDASYDAIIGNQVLHHFQLDQAMPNLRRLLKPGGKAVFCEPVLFLPEVFRNVRNSRRVTRFFPTRVDTPTERSISMADVSVIRATFPDARLYPFQLFTRAQNFVELSDEWFERLSQLDRAFLTHVPPTRRFCRYVVCDLVPTPTSKPDKEMLPR